VIIRAASMHKIGRNRLPPAKTLCRMARWIHLRPLRFRRQQSASKRRRREHGVPSSMFCFNIAKSEYNKRDSLEQAATRRAQCNPTGMRAQQKVIDGGGGQPRS